MFFGMLALMAEFESDLIRSRTVEGMREAAKRGRLLGKPSKLSVLQRKRLLADYESGEYSAAQLMDISGLSRSATYATLHKAREEQRGSREHRWGMRWCVAWKVTLSGGGQHCPAGRRRTPQPRRRGIHHRVRLGGGASPVRDVGTGHHQQRHRPLHPPNPPRAIAPP